MKINSKLEKVIVLGEGYNFRDYIFVFKDQLLYIKNEDMGHGWETEIKEIKDRKKIKEYLNLEIESKEKIHKEEFDLGYFLPSQKEKILFGVSSVIEVLYAKNYLCI